MSPNMDIKYLSLLMGIALNTINPIDFNIIHTTMYTNVYSAFNYYQICRLYISSKLYINGLQGNQ